MQQAQWQWAVRAIKRANGARFWLPEGCTGCRQFALCLKCTISGHEWSDAILKPIWCKWVAHNWYCSLPFQSDPSRLALSKLCWGAAAKFRWRPSDENKEITKKGKQAHQIGARHTALSDLICWAPVNWQMNCRDELSIESIDGHKWPAKWAAEERLSQQTLPDTRCTWPLWPGRLMKKAARICKVNSWDATLGQFASAVQSKWSEDRVEKATANLNPSRVN